MPAVLDKLGNIGEGRKLKNLEAIAKIVNTFEPEVEDLSDDELRANTAELRIITARAWHSTATTSGCETISACLCLRAETILPRSTC